MTETSLDAESTSHIVEIAGLPVRYHDSGAAHAGAAAGTGRGDADTVVLLHGGGPGASSWSNFGKTMPVHRQALPRADDGPARLRPI